METIIFRNESESFLLAWINRQVADYKEPVRKGTPKGSLIGLSRQKYAAALLCLTSMKQKDAAERVGVSLGLYQKWRTEQNFLDVAESSGWHYAKDFCNFLLRRAKAKDSFKVTAEHDSPFAVFVAKIPDLQTPELYHVSLVEKIVLEIGRQSFDLVNLALLKKTGPDLFSEWALGFAEKIFTEHFRLKISLEKITEHRVDQIILSLYGKKSLNEEEIQTLMRRLIMIKQTEGIY